jgi:hypothetical protein
MRCAAGERTTGSAGGEVTIVSVLCAIRFPLCEWPVTAQEVQELQQGCADQSKTRIPHFLHLLQALTEKTATDPNATAFGSSVIPSLAQLEQKA